MYDILTFGDLCVDLIVSGGDVVPEFGQVEKLVGEYTLEMGSSCSIFACQAARLGMKVAIVGRVGRDAFGELVLTRLTEAGVDTRFVETDPGLKTGLGIALYKENDRAILTYPGTITAIQPAEISDELLAQARHLHHGSYFLQTPLRPHIPEIFSRARQLGLTISLDTNWDPEDRWQGVAELLPLVDVFLPNEQEAGRIAKNETGNVIRDLHEMGAHLVVVKRGAAGAVASDGQEIISQEVEPVSGGDSIGAGDSFDAGFLTGWLRGLPLAESLRIGCACGRSVAARIGGLAGQSRWEDIK
jgi:sugar/nucleoside kinase (ribokinase family)